MNTRTDWKLTYSATITLVTSGAFSKLSFCLDARNGSCGADQGPTAVKHYMLSPEG